MDAFKVLEPIDIQQPLDVRALPSLGDAFYIPNLEDQPQNPIILNLNKKLDNTSQLSHRIFIQHRINQNSPKELTLLLGSALDGGTTQQTDDNIWLRAAKRPLESSNHIVSWDTLRPTYKHPDTPSPFLTEQDPYIVNATRHHVNPRMFDPNCEPVYVTAEDLLQDLKSTLVACSSALHIWDPNTERFIPTGSTYDTKKVLIITGMDEVISQSFVERFITIGTLLRRLEIYATSLRRLESSDDSISFAFGHALASVTVSLREMISLTAQIDSRLSSSRLSRLWTSLSELEDVLVSLASLCRREISKVPQAYKDLPTLPRPLLSHIYEHLYKSIEKDSPRYLVSLLAYILTVASRPFFRRICRSVGFKGLEQSTRDMKQWAIKHRQEVAAGIFTDGDADDDDAVAGDDEGYDLEMGNTDERKAKTEFPDFMDKDVSDAVIGARRSLKILFTYELDHDQVLSIPDLPLVEWVWTEDELSSLFISNGTKRTEPGPLSTVVDSPAGPTPLNQEPCQYKPELASLAKFDLPPGSTIAQPYTCTSFLRTFPRTLPSLTPSLPILTRTIFTPLLAHSLILSSAALKIFMTPGTRLHFRTHLLLLRSYLLVTAEGFRGRMEAALFDDGEWEEEEERSGGPSRKGKVVILRKKASSPDLQSKSPWAVGLAPSLTDRGTWPPGGSDLGIALRHVIMDSVDDVRQSVFTRLKLPPGLGSTERIDGELVTEILHDDLGCDDFWEDVEARLGFTTESLRDTGKEKWLDPTSIESLDFLYLVYKPPRPLGNLITQEILSKYRRIFSFLLRLMRVENALKVVFRLTRPKAHPLFHPTSSAQKTLLTLRLKMHSFLTTLTSYVYTTAIGGNIDSLINRLLIAEQSPSTGYTLPSVFSDVFGLMTHHSAVMDDVMTACMLRSAQGKLRDVVKACLESVLSFATLVGEVRRGRVAVEDAEKRMKRIGQRFEEKVKVLVKLLRSSTDHGSAPLPTSPSKSDLTSDSKRAPGGLAALTDLGLRLEMSDYWKQMTPPGRS